MKKFHKRPAKHSRSTSWNQVAGWYDKTVGDRGSDYHQNVIVPGALRLLAPERDEKILDAACGQGVFCRALAEKGATVIGIDNSSNLINAAKKRSHQINIKYFVADATNLTSFSDQSFDAVSCIMALQNIESLDKAIAEFSRVLKNGGRLLLVMNHPCFRIPRQSGWGTDEKRKLQYRRIDSYISEMKIPIQMHPGAAPDVHTWSFHRPLEKYFGEFHKNRLLVSQLEEWTSHRQSLPGSVARRENRARQEIPLFLALAAVKISK
ncbi:class I SAM-dependent methyltransferase [Candidatus Saganbacteria bacterium]|nr:class I SAM-dependent methyltransferase [Candidatus Saganbacteria bacterium]